MMFNGRKVAVTDPGIFLSSGLGIVIMYVKKDDRSMGNPATVPRQGDQMDVLSARVLELQADNHRFEKMCPAFVEKIFG